MGTANRNVIIKPSRSHPGDWYWRVVADNGETYAEGEDSYSRALSKASGNLKEYKQQQEGVAHA